MSFEYAHVKREVIDGKIPETNSINQKSKAFFFLQTRGQNGICLFLANRDTEKITWNLNWKLIAGLSERRKRRIAHAQLSLSI